MTYPKLKPCRKCGTADDLAVYRYESGTKHVECDGCWYLGPGEGSILAAIRSHNERAVRPWAEETQP